MSSNSSSPVNSNSFSSSETPPKKFRSLRKIYAYGSFTLCVLDPEFYDEKMHKYKNGAMLWMKRLLQSRKIKLEK